MAALIHPPPLPPSPPPSPLAAPSALRRNQAHVSFFHEQELARLIDDTGKQQAELERETMAFKEKFAAQLHQAEKQLRHFDKEITELRDAVIALEKRFEEQEEQMAK